MFRTRFLLCLSLVSCQAIDAPMDVESTRQPLGTPVPLGDLNPGTVTPHPSSSPFGFTPLGARTLFFASSGSEGVELWSTDGTAAGTTLVLDVWPGSTSGVSSTAALVTVGSVAYFRASRSSTGTELWRTDGTPEGTRLAVEVARGTAPGVDSEPVLLGSTLVFAGSSTGGFPYGLYVSDGTQAGTTRIGNLPCRVQEFVPAGTKLFFRCSMVNELHSTDGTLAGTQSIALQGNPSFLTAQGSSVFFILRPGTNNLLWKSDGTTAGTVFVQDLGTNGIRSMTVSGGLVYVGGTSDIWVSDGTTDAGRLISAPNLATIPAAVPPNRLVFTGPTLEPWVSDGTDAGTFQLQDTTAAAAGNQGRYWTVGDEAWFPVANSVWRSDGTASGTVRAGFVDGGTNLTVFAAGHGGNTYFSAQVASAGQEPWIADGTPNGARLLADVNRTRGLGSGTLSESVRLGNVLLFAADQAATGIELWRTDGTSAGTELLQDLRTGTGDSDPSSFVEAQGKAYFTASTATTGTELWRTDGSDAGVELLQIVPGSNSASIASLTGTPLGAFATVRTATGYSVRAWLGPDAGMTTVADFGFPSAPARPPGLFTFVGGTVYFYAWTPGAAGQVWRTDGTAQNTVAVTSLSVAEGNQLYFFTSFENRLYFTSNSVRLMRLECDGTHSTLSTNPVAYPTAVGSTLFMTGGSGLEYELWKLTDAGAARVIDVFDGGNDNPRELTAWNGRVAYLANDATGRHLYASDGTAAGTVQLSSLAMEPSGHGREAAFLAVPGGELYAAGWTPDSGLELWQVARDGGQVLVADLHPGAGNANPLGLALLGGKLIFSADDLTSGREPWAVDVDRDPMTPGPGLQAPCMWAVPDGGVVDAGVGSFDAGSSDAGTSDAGSIDAGPEDAGFIDAGPEDAGFIDAGGIGGGGGSASGGGGGSATGGGDGAAPGGCGCTSVDAWPLMLALASLLARRKKTR